MRLFALADPHLSFGIPNRAMDKFGQQWVGHPTKIAAAWRRMVSPNDVVLVAGDISWALRLDEAEPDLQFLGNLPGTKVLIKGNHDYWWHSASKVRAALPPGMIALQHDAISLRGMVICGTRLWDVPGVDFNHLIEWMPGTTGERAVETDDIRIYDREVERLQRALNDAVQLREEAGTRLTIAMTHYPPCDAELHANQLTRMFERAGVQHVVFGHLHSLRRGVRMFGERNGVHYHLTSSDHLDFRPRLLAKLDD